MPTFRNSVLPLVDKLRGLPTLFGLRPHIVSVRIRTWTGERPGIGGYTDTVTGLRTDLAIGQVKVRNMTQQDVIASGGLFTTQDLIVGPITPPYPGSIKDNSAISVFQPPVANSPVEVIYNIQGPGYSPTGDYFRQKMVRVDQSFRYMIYLEKTGEVSFAPNQIAGCKLWLRADTGVVLNGDTVSTWQDQSGLGHDMAQAVNAQQPTFVASGGPNGLPYVQGVSSWMSAAFNMPQPCDVFLIAKWSPSVSGETILDGAFTNNNRLSWNSGTSLTYSATGGGLSITQSLPSPAAWAVYNLFANAGSSSTTIGGLTVNGNIGVGNPSGVSIFDIQGSGLPANAGICEVLAYSSMTPLTRASVIQYLRSRGGVQ